MGLENLLIGKIGKPAKPPKPPTRADAEQKAAEVRAAIAASNGLSSTIRTGSQGVSDSNIGVKRLLGE